MQEEGHKKLFALEVPETPSSGKVSSVTPRKLTTAHNVSTAVVLPHLFSKDGAISSSSHSDRLLVTVNSFTSPNEAYLLAVPSSSREKPVLQQVSSLSTGLTEKLSLDAGEEFWFTGAAPDKQVHGFVMKPHGYEKGRKYGLVFLVHGRPLLTTIVNYQADILQLLGGPQSAWTDSW